jgi:hypothetical protein
MDTSYEDLTKLVKNSVGTSPFIKQEKVMQSLNSAIEKGIAYNVEERAFLDTLSDSVATTFEAFDATLEEMVRIQQADSTAYRLGMEASLTEYLNSMFESTAYLNGVSDTVTKNLYQASSLLSAADSIGFEYQIQKWMGALYSVGMSSSAIGNISSTLGGMLSGDVSVLSNDSGRLLTMAASNTGNVDLATMLTDGLDSSELNDLMKSMVEYLQTIASDNKVVQNQYAKLFGLSVADIKAAGNLTSVVEEIYTSQSNYTSQNAQTMLNTMMTSISERVSAGAAMENLKDNFKYTLASGIASNPALYTTYALGSILNDTVGGIAIPAFSVMGNMVDLETTIADLMLAGSLGVSAMSGIGSMLSGLGQLASGDISGVFDKFHGESETQTRLGSSVQASLSQGGFNNKKGKSKSSRGASYAGNNSGDDYTNSNDAMVEDTKAQQAGTVEETDDADTNDLYDNGLRIIELLESLVNHETSIRVISTAEESSHPFLSKYL